MAMRVLAACVLATAISGCSSELPPPPPTVPVSMREFSYDLDRAAVTRGRVVFRVTNAGRLDHELALLQVPANVPPIEVQVRGAERRILTERASTPALQPGGSDTFAADLTPGRWAFVCFVMGPEGSHASRGMATEFRVP